MYARLAVFLVACGGKADVVPGSGNGPGSGSGSTADTLSWQLGKNDPAFAVIQQAFDNKPPRLPQLSKDGDVAVVEIVTPIGMSGGSTYAVSFVPAGGDAWAGSEPEVVTLVDARLVHLLLDAKESSSIPTFDRDTIAKAAREVGDRLSTGGFTRFEGSAAISAGGGTAGPFTIAVTEEATKAITITIGDGGKPLAHEQIEPVPMGIVGDVDCLAAPVIERVWFDGGRRRLLLHVGWKTNAAPCSAPDARYRLVGAR